MYIIYIYVPNMHTNIYRYKFICATSSSHVWITNIHHDLHNPKDVANE